MFILEINYIFGENICGCLYNCVGGDTFGKGGCLSMVIVSSWRCKHIKILAAFSFGLNLTNGEMGNMRI